jgi:hypothetical protein
VRLREKQIFRALVPRRIQHRNTLNAQKYRLTRRFQHGTPMQAQTGVMPSTKINRRSSAVRRTFSASAYSGEAYHSRKRSIVGNSTTMIVFGAGRLRSG